MALYFAYGSSMNQKSLAQSGVQFGLVGTAVLKNYRLAFSRLAFGGGVADVAREKGCQVEGVLYEVRDFRALDKREGAPWVYRRVKVRVYPTNSQAWVLAWTYMVINKAPVEYAPSPAYAKILLEGAEVLSDEYQKMLKRHLQRKNLIRLNSQLDL